MSTKDGEPNMIRLPGIKVLAQIYESANSLVYRGIREEDNQPLILKLLKEDYPTPAELFRNILRQVKFVDYAQGIAPPGYC
ncbi:hypothetical protein NDI47_15195 [Microcoleus vaginatus GB1-A2]|uniref:hypothetical protein n=1 Tax=Microcoleus vaginatus TaxID=119532 RepID=UPI00168472C4|nr:hypothetical protein [Microcoleus sp. FACHB-61]